METILLVVAMVASLATLGVGAVYARQIFEWLARCFESIYGTLVEVCHRGPIIPRRELEAIARREEERRAVQRDHEERLKVKRAERSRMERVWRLRVEGCHPRWIKEEVIDKDPWWLQSAESRQFAMDVLGPVSSWPDGPEPWSDKAQRIAGATQTTTFATREEGLRWLQSKGAIIVPAEERDGAFKLGGKLPERTYREYEWLLELSPMDLKRVRGTRWYYAQLDREIEKLFDRRSRSLPAANRHPNVYLTHIDKY